MKNRIGFLLAIILITIATGCGGESSATAKKLNHVLLFKWKPSVTDAEVLVLSDLWRDLVQEVSGFEEFEMYRVNAGDHDHVVMLTFSGEAAHQQYLSHEKHLRIAELGKDMVDQFFSYSYWK